MKLLIDIGHPAHVHYFKYFIETMKNKGHAVLVIARDKEVALSLLDYYKIPYINRGKGNTGFIGKMLYIFKADLFILKQALKFKPDFFISAGSPYSAHVSWLLRKPHIALDDTDHNAFQHLLYVPFTKVILTPKVFQKDFGSKHLRFDGFLELGGLHPNRLERTEVNIHEILSIKEKEPYVILRFVAWTATHDKGLAGLSASDKYNLVEQLSEHAKVIISSEAPLPNDLKKFAFRVHPALMHQVLSEARLLVSESLTMAAEASFLGTPALCISTAKAGTLDEEVKLGLIELFRNSSGLLERAVELTKNSAYKEQFKNRTKHIVQNKTDLTSFLVWFVENYPASFKQYQGKQQIITNVNN